MCRQIAVFANASTDHALHEVELITRWDGPLSFVRMCNHDSGYKPAVRLCAFLEQHASAESAESNVVGALSCLPGGKVFVHDSFDGLLTSDTGSFASEKARYTDPGVEVTIYWATRKARDLNSMKISVQPVK
jgi:hypothetical protein